MGRHLPAAWSARVHGRGGRRTGWVRPGEVLPRPGPHHPAGRGHRALPALHLVSAWAGANHLTLGQVAVEGKSNEITAIPKLLELLDLNGCLVSIDAIGCQKDIAQKIVT